MGRIVAKTTVTNLFDDSKSIQCGMLVDAGAGALILPASWKARLGEFGRSEPVELQLANQGVVRRRGLLARGDQDRRLPTHL